MTQGMSRGLQRIAVVLVAIGALDAYVPDAYANDALFRCQQQGVVVITDRPIDQTNCQPLSVSMTSRADAVPTVSSSSKTHQPAKSQHDSIASEQVKAKQRCDRIRLRLDEIANKQRSGYTLQQGERLKERQRTLEAESRIEQCN
jgi:hypothetical protein